MDTLFLRPELKLRFKNIEAGVRYYGSYVLFDILLEYHWAGDWHRLVQRTIKVNITEQMIIQEQIILDQRKAVQDNKSHKAGPVAGFSEQFSPACPTDYFEAVHSIVQKRANRYFETVLVPVYNQYLEDESSPETLRQGLKAVQKAVEMSNSFGR